VPKSSGAVFAIVVGQAYATALSSGIPRLAYRARPDIEARDPAGSAARQRAVRLALARAVLTLIALVNVTLLLVALRQWQLWHPSGTAEPLTLLPFALGFAALIVMLWRARAVLSAAPADGAPDGIADRDDDRFWKGGIVYVNNGDPAVMVSARFGAGWTLNLGNPRAWMIVAAVIATPRDWPRSSWPRGRYRQRRISRSSAGPVPWRRSPPPSGWTRRAWRRRAAGGS
jgi:uncharacterized membrane protein